MTSEDAKKSLAQTSSSHSGEAVQDLSLSPVLGEVPLKLYCIWSQSTASVREGGGVTTVSSYRYTPHLCTISPSGNQLKRNTVRTSLYCAGCHRLVEVLAKECSYAKFPKELIRSDDSLFWKLLVNEISRSLLGVLILCASLVTGFTLIVLQHDGLPALRDSFFPQALAVIGGACGLIFVALAIIKFRMLRGDFLIWRDDSVVLELGNLRTPFAKTLMRKSPHALVRAVSELRVIDTSRHAVSHTGGEFRARSHTLNFGPRFV